MFGIILMEERYRLSEKFWVTDTQWRDVLRPAFNDWRSQIFSYEPIYNLRQRPTRPFLGNIKNEASVLQFIEDFWPYRKYGGRKRMGQLFR